MSRPRWCRHCRGPMRRPRSIRLLHRSCRRETGPACPYASPRARPDGRQTQHDANCQGISRALLIPTSADRRGVTTWQSSAQADPTVQVHSSHPRRSPPWSAVYGPESRGGQPRVSSRTPKGRRRAAFIGGLLSACRPSSPCPVRAHVPTTDVTWARDIAPIVEQRCLGCHRAGGVLLAAARVL